MNVTPSTSAKPCSMPGNKTVTNKWKSLVLWEWDSETLNNFLSVTCCKGNDVNFKSVFLWSLGVLLTAPHMNLIQVVLFSEKERIFQTQMNNRLIGILFFVTTTLCSMVILDKQGLGTSNLVKQWEGGTDWALSPTLGLKGLFSKEADTQKIMSKQKVGS